jgi:hypothetical protein
MMRLEQQAAQSEPLEASSVTERRLPSRLGEMVAAQAVEDEAGEPASAAALARPALYHRYNAALKRVCGKKGRAEMTLAELDAAIGWLGVTVCLSICICLIKIRAIYGQRASAVSGNRRSDRTNEPQRGCKTIPTRR